MAEDNNQEEEKNNDENENESNQNNDKNENPVTSFKWSFNQIPLTDKTRC